MNGVGAQGKVNTLDSRLLEHRRIWREKPALRALYADYHRRLREVCPSGPILDIGGGSAHVKEFHADVISIDILPFPGIDVVCDAHQLPFQSGNFGGVVMLDVLHHLERPVKFLNEAARVLRVGGVLAMIEPGMSLISYPFYHYLHQETADLNVDAFAEQLVSSKDPFDSNQAIPTLLFGRENNLRELSRRIPQFELLKIDWLALFSYPLSGGFKNWCLLPARQVSRILRFEDALPLSIRKMFGFRLMVVLVRI